MTLHHTAVPTERLQDTHTVRRQLLLSCDADDLSVVILSGIAASFGAVFAALGLLRIPASVESNASHTLPQGAATRCAYYTAAALALLTSVIAFLCLHKKGSGLRGSGSKSLLSEEGEDGEGILGEERGGGLDGVRQRQGDRGGDGNGIVEERGTEDGDLQENVSMKATKLWRFVKESAQLLWDDPTVKIVLASFRILLVFCVLILRL